VKAITKSSTTGQITAFLRVRYWVVLAALSLAAGNGCSGPDSSSPGTSDANSTPPTATAAVAPSGAPPKAVVSGENIKISGSGSGAVKIAARQGGYLVNYRYKGFGLKLEAQSAFGAMNVIPGGQYAGPDGWTQFTDLTSFSSSGEQEYKVTATEPYEIEFVKLPVAQGADVLPKTYNGKGLKVVGPLSLKAGPASYKVSCPDLKMAGFVAELFDGASGQSKGMISLGTGAGVNETKKLDAPAAGNYLIKVNANGKAEWTIEVSQ